MLNNSVVISALFREMDVLGVTEFCIAAGARNAPVIAALMQREQLVIRNFFDERSAAFFALGRVMQTGKPVAVLTTSGTAVAELFPAVMEAHYQNAPLVVVSADRPSSYRGSGAPQAVEQSGIFGDYVTRTLEIEDDCGLRIADSGLGSFSGVTHINICLDEALVDADEVSVSGVDDEKIWRAEIGAMTEINALEKTNWREFCAADGSLVVLVSGIHPDDLDDVREFLLKLNAPIIAEATSNLCGDKLLQKLLVHGGEKTLGSLNAKRVLRIGAVPSWRWWRDLEACEDVSVLSIARAQFRGLARSQNVSVMPWKMIRSSEFRVQSSELPALDTRSEKLTNLLDLFPNAETAWMRHLSKIIGEGSTVFLGNSLPIREWNLAAEMPKRGTSFFANRGANGIDGLVSTWLGVSAEAAESWLIVGDLSVLYDLNAPWILPQLRKAKRRIVVINNGGGKIFSRVGWLNTLDDEVRSVVENRHALGFESWAKMWGLDYKLITDWKQLSDDESDTTVWEIRPDAEETELFWNMKHDL